MKIGMMGGTYNPPHIGHLEAGRAVYEALHLDKILFIPTNVPPHKQLPAGSATTEQRCEMVQRMLADCPWAELSTIEIDRGGASYTVDTLRALHATGLYDSVALIMGTDMLLRFDSIWRAHDEIARLAELAVVSRHEDDRAALEEKAAQLRETLGARIHLVRAPVIDISSTELREGENLEKYTAPAVAQYIKEHHLYEASR